MGEVSKTNRGFSIGKDFVKAVKGTADLCRKLPVSARPAVDAADVVVPEGYQVEVVMAGLSFPTDIAFADDGTIFVSEGGSSWPTRPYMTARILMLNTEGKVEAITMNVQA
ncbi:MAG TPA: hypothetical protein VF700_02435, partial [Segetibacter sp.]